MGEEQARLEVAEAVADLQMDQTAASRIDLITLNLATEVNSIRAQRTKHMCAIMLAILGVALGLIYAFNVRFAFFGQQQHVILVAAGFTCASCCAVAAIARCIKVSGCCFST